MKIFAELEANTLELMEETQLSLTMVEALDSYIAEHEDPGVVTGDADTDEVGLLSQHHIISRVKGKNEY